MRLLSIGQWHHFAYMVISMALLGFGAAGSLLFLLYDRISRNRDRWLFTLAWATAVSFPLSFSMSQGMGLDPLQLIWQPYQWLRMLATYLLMAIPFLFAGGIVGIILTAAGKQAHRMYAVDLLSAGFGALGIVPALYVGVPWRLLPIIGYLMILGSVWVCFRTRRAMTGIISLLIVGAVLAVAYRVMPPIPRIHETKGLPMTLALPDARIEAEKAGPLGMIHVVGSSLIRHAPGLSLNFGLGSREQAVDIPEQKAVFVDADGLSPITSFTGDLDELKYLDFTSMALPYHIRSPARVLVVGAGGGTDILLGLLHRAIEVTALEANQQIADQLLKTFAGFSGDLYTRPDVSLETREARQFFHSTSERYDLIQLSMIDSFAHSAGGLHSATESYLYTTEAFEQYLTHLTDKGILAVTRWLKLPPRDSLRTIATALSALERLRISAQPERHLIFIRSWKTFTILLSRTPFSSDEVMKAMTFCNDRSFDMVYYSGMKEDKANRYDILESPYYFYGASALCGTEAEPFLERYIFDVSATTDDRPFFSHFLRWRKAPALLRHIKREWLPMVEMGYLFIIATLVQALLAGVLLILLPLIFLRRSHTQSDGVGSGPGPSGMKAAIIYFSSIGVGFMFFEMAFLPRFTLLLSHPVYAAAVVLASLLVFAGLGSLSVKRFQTASPWFLWAPVTVITGWVLLQVVSGDRLFDSALGWPFAQRLGFTVLLLSVPSFFLGWPFPSGLRVMAERYPRLVPWAWGINGCASVIGAVLGKCLAVSIGFKLLMSSACLLYFFAVSTFYIAFRPRDASLRIRESSTP